MPARSSRPARSGRSCVRRCIPTRGACWPRRRMAPSAATGWEPSRGRHRHSTGRRRVARSHRAAPRLKRVAPRLYPRRLTWARVGWPVASSPNVQLPPVRSGYASASRRMTREGRGSAKWRRETGESPNRPAVAASQPWRGTRFPSTSSRLAAPKRERRAGGGGRETGFEPSPRPISPGSTLAATKGTDLINRWFPPDKTRAERSKTPWRRSKPFKKGVDALRPSKVNLCIAA